ncbi:hypothetical protein PQY67_05085 [Pseudomonadales bacterium]|nr:hypothetical protein [Pseudomonadales bacterium]
MKVLLFYIGTPSPILEIEMELIKKHDKAGDIVSVVQCTGNLPNCHWNLEHSESVCGVCRSKFRHGLDSLNLGENVNLKEFPTSDEVTNLDFPESFDSNEDVSNYEYDGEKIGFGTTATLVSLTRDHRFDKAKHLEDIYRTLRTSVIIYDTLKKQMEEFKPDLVYFFNGRIATHLPAKLLCKQLGLNYYSYETSRVHNHYRQFKNTTVHEPHISNVKNWTDEQLKLGESLLRRMRGGVDPSIKNFNQDQKKGVLPEGFNPNKRNIAIFCGTLDEYEGVEWGTNKIYKPDQTAGISKILESLEHRSDFIFYIRLHPHMADLPRTNSQLSDVQSISDRYSNAYIIWPEDEMDTYALMENCEKVVTFGSSTGVEATYWGRPSILADFSIFQMFEYAYMPDTHEEVIQLLLTNNLEPKAAESSIKAVYTLYYRGAEPYKFFEESQRQNGVGSLTYNGVRLRAARLPILWRWLCVFPRRFLRIVRNPSLVLKKYNVLW